MTRYLLLFLLVACASKEAPNEKRVHYVETSNEVNQNFKSRLGQENKNRLVNVYWDFYSFSLRKNCPGVKYKDFYPGNPSLNLPAIRFAEIKPGTKAEDGVLHGGSFDLSTQLDDQRYKAFQIETQAFERKSEVDKDKRIILLRTGNAENTRYIVCSDQGNDKVLCTDDKLIRELTQIEDMNKLCKLVKGRGKSVSKDRVLDGTLRIMDALKLI